MNQPSLLETSPRPELGSDEAEFLRTPSQLIAARDRGWRDHMHAIRFLPGDAGSTLINFSAGLSGMPESPQFISFWEARPEYSIEDLACEIGDMCTKTVVVCPPVADQTKQLFADAIVGSDYPYMQQGLMVVDNTQSPIDEGGKILGCHF